MPPDAVDQELAELVARRGAPAAAADPEPVEVGSPGMFEAIVRSSVSPFVIVALTGEILWAGTQVEQLVGLPAEDFVGRHFLDQIAPESQEAAIAAFVGFVEAPEPQPWIGPPMLLELLRADGTTVTCEVSAALGTPYGIDGAIVQVRRWRGTVLLYEAVDAMAAGAPLEQVLGRLVELVEHDSPGSVGTVLTGWDGARWTTVVHGPHPPEATVAAVRSVLERPEGLAAVVRRGELVGCSGLDPAMVALARQAGHHECWVVPVPVRERRAPGSALVVWRDAPGSPQPHLVTTVARVSRLVGLAIENHQSRLALRQAAMTDELTGLGSRAALDEHLAAVGSDGPRSVLFCDLDGFKEINDDLGHEVGDEVLRIVAERLRAALRPGDLAIRWGGDEFAIICLGPIDPAALAGRIIDRVNEPIVLSEHRIDLGISIGVASAPDAGPIDDLLRRGDDALRSAKATGKNRWLIAS